MSELVIIKPKFYPLEVLVDRFLKDGPDIEAYKEIAFKSAGTRLVLGSWLYSIRENTHRGSLGNEYHVDPDSLDPSRTRLIRGAIQYIDSLNLNETSIGSTLHNFNPFMTWLNTEWTSSSPTSIPEAKAVYRAYTHYLNEVLKRHDPRIKKANNFGQRTANRYQTTALGLLVNTFEVEEVTISGYVEKITITQRNGTSKKSSKDYDLDDDKIDEATSYFFQFFEQVADFLLNEKNYPYKISLLEHQVLLVPEKSNQQPVISPYKVSRRAKGQYWDLEKGELRSWSEIRKNVMSESRYQRASPSRRGEIIKRTVRSFENKKNFVLEANRKKDHTFRLKLGVKAMKAFFLALLDITGMNDSTLATIKWYEDEFIEEAEEQAFRNIKRRAGNKEVVFKLQSIFVPYFRTLIKLRRFVLNGHLCDTLFFTGTGKDAYVSRAQTRGTFNHECYKVFSRLYPDLYHTGSRSTRQYKKKWIMKHTNDNIYLSASILQHTPDVSELNYPHETRKESEEQVGNWFTYQHIIIESFREETAVGGCDSPEHDPRSDSDTPSVKPDCSNTMTCLFCIFYRIQPDDENIRKILSLEFVINNISVLHARSRAHFDSVMGPILKRIETLLKTIEHKHPETASLIINVREDVYENQNLHWYWETKLEHLWEIGWV